MPNRSSILVLLLPLASAFQCAPTRAPVARVSEMDHRRLAVAPAMAVGKAELTDAIAKKAGVSKKTASTVLAAALDVIVESVSETQKVSLVGFGTFASKERPTREARNPKTGEKMMVPAALVPTFSFGKSFKDAVKEAGKKQGI